MATNSPISRVSAAPLMALIWVALCPSALAAAPATAVLRTSANVRVNGATVARSTVLFTGDVVRTQEMPVSLEMTGSGIFLDKDSTAILQDEQLSVICGDAIIKTVRGLGARVGKLEVRPLGQSARFEILRRKKSVKVTALDGDLKISDGRQKIVLSAGRQLELSCSKCGQPATMAEVANRFTEVETTMSGACELPALLENGSTPLVAFVHGASASTIALWVDAEKLTPISPDHL